MYTYIHINIYEGHTFIYIYKHYGLSEKYTVNVYNTLSDNSMNFQ